MEEKKTYTTAAENKFHKGNGSDGKHYWLTPPDLMRQLQEKEPVDTSRNLC